MEDEIDESLFPASRLLRARKLKRVIFAALLFVVFLCIGFGAARGHFFSSPPSIISLRKMHPDFLGREVHLKTLEKALLAKRWSLKGNFPLSVRVLWGIGGIGKTELAIKYANDHLDDYSLIWRFDCGSTELFEKGYRILAERLKLPVDVKTPFLVVRRKVHTFLEERKFHKPWLLIFDNVENELMDNDLPFRGGAVIITAREANVRRNQREHLPVSVFSKAEALKLLEKVTGEQFSKEMDRLVEEFYSFPLTLNQIAHYIQETPSINIASYLRAYLRQQNPLYAPTSQEQQYNYTLQNVWDVTLEKLRQEFPLALYFLEVCSYLAPDHIPFGWFQKGSIFEGQMDEIIRHLQRLSLIIYNADDQTFSLHRLVREVIQERQKEPQKKLLFVLELLTSNENFQLANIASWETGTRWFAHAEAFVSSQHFDELKQPELCSILYCKIAKGLNILKDFQSALQYCNRALNLCNDQEFSRSSFCEVSYLKARTLCHLSRFSDAQTCLEDVLQHCSANHNKECRWRIYNLDTLLRIYNYLGKFTKAIEAGEKSFKYLASLEMEDVDRLGDIFYDLAWVLLKMDRISKAKKHGETALACYTPRREEKVSDIAWVSMLLSRIYIYAGEIKKAEEKFAEALEIFQRFHPKGASLLLIPSVAKAEIFQAQGAYKEIVELVGDIYDIRFRDQQNYWVAVFLSCRGLANCELGSYEEAESVHRAALETFIKIFGEESYDVARELRRLGKCLRKMGQIEEALEAQVKVINTLQALFPSGHSILAAAYKEMGACFYELGRFKEAVGACEKSLSYWDGEVKREHPQKAKTLQVLGQIYRAMGEQQQAQETILEACLVAHHTYYEKHPHLKQYCSQLAEVYAEANDLSWKKEVKEVAYPLVKKTMGRWHPITRKVNRSSF